MRNFWLRAAYYLLFNIAFFSIAIAGLKRLFDFLSFSTILMNLIFFCLFILILTLEISIRIFNRKNNSNKNFESPHRILLEQRLITISNSPFSIKTFLAELDIYYKFGLTIKTGNYRSPVDFQGEYINIVSGIRKGLFSDEGFKSIFMLGGSTVACLEGPDDWTLPSRLQKNICDSGKKFNVVNLGVSGSTTFDRFKAAISCSLLKPNDILFFWFGVNEGKGLWGRRGRGALAYWPGYVEILGLLSRRLNLQVLRLIYLVTVVFDENAQRRLARSRAKNLKKQFDHESDRWSNRNVKLIAGLQPTIFSSKVSPEHRSELSKNWKPEMEKIMKIQYEEFRVAFQNSEYFLDFSQLDKLSSHDIFIDWAHTSWKGNEMIAKEIVSSQKFQKIVF